MGAISRIHKEQAGDLRRLQAAWSVQVGVHYRIRQYVTLYYYLRITDMAAQCSAVAGWRIRGV